MRRMFLGVLTALALAIGLNAQTRDLAHDTMVMPDKVMFGNGEFLPRYLTAPRRLVVPAGQTVDLPATSTWDYIEVAGTLRLPQGRDTALTYTTLTVLPGGFYDACPAGGLSPENTFTQTIRNAPIDTAEDPFQWGHGLVNNGKWALCGAPMLEWSPVQNGLSRGMTTAVLDREPVGWRVGQKLVFPDTDQLPQGISDQTPNKPKREPEIVITAVAGKTVTWSPALTFDHPSIMTPDMIDPVTGATIPGQELLTPRVANISRNVIVQSESATGVRGHTANIGHGADSGMWTIKHAAFVNLGRTRPEVLDDTTLDLSHIGTNQRGKYALHFHHSEANGSLVEGAVVLGGGKFGLAVHNSHFGRYIRNVIIGLTGAGLVTEDGDEYANVFDGNFVAYVDGNMPNDQTSDKEFRNTEQNNPGVAGACGWFHGIRQYFYRNEGWNCAVGFNLFNVSTVTATYPTKAGGPFDALFDNVARIEAVPLALEDNVTAANYILGCEGWGLRGKPGAYVTWLRHISANNSFSQCFFSVSSPMFVRLVDSLLIGHNGQGTGLASGMPYTERVEFIRGMIAGNKIGIQFGGQSTYFLGTKMANRLDFDYTQVNPFGAVHEDVLSYQQPGFPLRAVDFSDRKVWDPSEGLPGGQDQRSGLPHYAQQQGGPYYTLKNWQGTGKDYQLLKPQQNGKNIAWHSADSPHLNHRWNCPEQGITQQLCYDKYGMGFDGDVYSDAEVVQLAGIEGGAVRPGIKVDTRPSLAIVTFPTLRAPAVVHPADNILGNWVEINGVMVGQASGMDAFWMSVDGDDANPRNAWWPNSPGQGPRTMRSYATSEGVHTIHTIRLNAAGAGVPGSDRFFQYFVGAVVPPIDPPVQPLVITCPANITVAAPQGATTKAVIFPAPVVSGGTTPYGAVTFSRPSGTLFQVGSTTVTATVKDKALKTASCPFIVTVTGFVPPATVWVTTATFQQEKGGSKTRIVYPDGTVKELAPPK